jgi:hypothetical protein
LQAARSNHGINVEAVCGGYATGSRLRIAKNVPVLRVNHVAVEDIVPGVREVARAGHDEIISFWNPYFQDTQRREGDQRALDNFRCASDSVASWFQPPRGRQSNSLAAGGCAGGTRH